MAKRHFVFLQGMPCGFFRRVGDALSASGQRVSRINLCFGDWLFWHDARALSYRGRYCDWPTFFRAFVTRQAVTDLVLLGEQRKYHREAVAVAQSLGVRVSVTDYGYLRPDWITLEADGMGGQSRFPRDPAQILAAAENLPEPDLSRRFADSDLAMSLGDLAYSFGNTFVGWPYPFYRRSEARPHPLLYFPAMGLRLLLAGRHGRAASARMDAIAKSGRPWFVVPLQLEHDFQIVAYSPFQTLDAAIDQITASFAAHADPASLLLFKSHPWEPGLKNWRRRVARIAADRGVADRVEFLDGGNLDAMMQGAAGVVTVNSTSGLKALQLGRPVKVLGQAIYDLPGLTQQTPLDNFWPAPSPPNPALASAFVRLLAHTIQLRGVFFSEPGISAAVAEMAKRLASEPPA